MRFGFALWIVLVLCVSCGNKQEKVTREQCAKVADHIAEVRIEHYAAHPDELWADATAQGGETGLPPTVTKETLKAFLATPEGKTWMMQRQGEVRTNAEGAIGICLDKATPKLVSCLLAAKSRDDVTACDQAK